MTKPKKKPPPPPPPTPLDNLVAVLRDADDLPPALADALAELPDDLAETLPELRHRLADVAHSVAVKRSPSTWSGRTAALAAMVVDDALRRDTVHADALDDAIAADPLTRPKVDTD